jgi:hypothetical protein
LYGAGGAKRRSAIEQGGTGFTDKKITLACKVRNTVNISVHADNYLEIGRK